jgi:hypothetical protein
MSCTKGSTGGGDQGFSSGGIGDTTLVIKHIYWMGLRSLWHFNFRCEHWLIQYIELAFRGGKRSWTL